MACIWGFRVYCVQQTGFGFQSEKFYRTDTENKYAFNFHTEAKIFSDHGTFTSLSFSMIPSMELFYRKPNFQRFLRQLLKPFI